MTCSLKGFTSILLCLVMVIKPTYSYSCGTLKFEQETIEECQSVRLNYTSSIDGARKWVKEEPTATIIYDSEKINDETKYIESKSGGSFILFISAVELTDSGRYIVNCGNAYSDRATLKVTKEKSGQGCMDHCGKLSVVGRTNINEGDQVQLKFTVYPGKSVTWEKKRGLNFEQLVDQRYIILPNTEETEKSIHSLTIAASEHSDGGEYRVNCGVNVSNIINLNVVYKKPSVPEFSKVVSPDYCKPEGCILANINEEVTVECFVQGGSKPVKLNMLKNGNILADAVKSEKKMNTKVYTYVKYTFIPTKLDIENGVILTCSANNPAISELLSNSTKLYIKVAPDKINVKRVEVKEDTDGEVQCIETNVRPPLKAKLLVNSREENNTIKKSEKISGNLFNVITSTSTRRFTRLDNQAKVTCCSIFGDKMCVKEKINVLFPPKHLSVQEISKENQENGDTRVQLKFFVAESNPKSSFEMRGLKHIKRTLVDKKYEKENNTHGWTFSALWNFNFSRVDNQRQIAFEAVTKGFPDQTLHNVYTINVTYYPIVTILGQSTIYLGDDVTLACKVDSSPLSTLSWYNQTDLIQESQGEATTNLHLKNVSMDHSQTYICTAFNGIGEMKSRNITLIVKDPSERPVTEAVKPTSESNIASVIGPVVGCLVLVILIAIIVALIMRKKRRNTPLQRKNTPQIKIEERKPSSQHVGNVPKTDHAVDEQPEYACVIPKTKRGKASGSTEAANDARKENKEREDNLVYADLDLADYPDIAASRPMVTMHEQTEYVSIDFSQTGTPMIDDEGGKN